LNLSNLILIMHRNSNNDFENYGYELVPVIGSLHQVAADIAGLRHIMANLYFIGDIGGDWTLVDTGLPGAADAILRAAEGRFGTKPKQILLTHGHFDHIGAVRNLAEFWDVPVFAHSLELPYLTGRSSYPPPDPSVGGGSMALMSGLYPRKPIDLGSRIQPLPHDGSVPGLPEWRWFHTPGHTPGHVSFFREKDRALIAGDAFVTVRQESALAVLQQRPELNGPPAYFTPDWDAARDSVQHLASLNPQIIATGHGTPMRGERARRELHQLAADFDQVARPARGRYVSTPAVANFDGVVSVPPINKEMKLMMICGLALLLGLLAGLLFGREDREV
jgi:glyoxylase-like metal-dependent hydrolase (beta-lactamase superfamily II)